MGPIKTICFIAVIILCIIRLEKEERPYPTGDAIEYTLMTEGFFNHFSPEIRSTDCVTFKQAYEKTSDWKKNEKGVTYDSVEKYVARKDLKNLDYNYALFVDKEGRKYSVHFWFYSLLNLPMRWLCAVVPFNPILIFHITNFLLIVITCFIFLKTTRFGAWETSVFCLLFFFSTNYWYFCWPHPEVFTVCFVSLGLWFCFHERWYLGILLTSMAALQNQPLAVLTVILGLNVLYKKGLNIRNIVKLFFSSVLILAPPIFYYIHYGTTNLIGYQGALSTKLITFNRVTGFFFDINQGVILALPLILLIYLFLYTRKLFTIKKAQTKWDMFLLPAAIMVVCGASTIDNWNHGQATVNRYVTYVGAIILVHFFFLLIESGKKRLQLIFGASLITQMVTVYYHQTLNRFDWTTNDPKPISNFVLSHFPSFYNPDPMIFNSRYGAGMGTNPAETPTYFMKEDGQITKFLIHKTYIANLQQFGLSPHQIDSIALTLNFTNDWAYLDVTENLRAILSPELLKKVHIERLLKEQIRVIKGTPQWYKEVKQKAVDQGFSEYEMLRMDAAYVLHIELKVNPAAKKQKVVAKISEMRENASWLKEITKKAQEKGITVDSALYVDALWVVEHESE